MRITQDMLIKLAKDLVTKRARSDKDLIAVYLTGSVAEGEPLLGGSTDIDLTFIHREQPALKREVLRVTAEISFDINTITKVFTLIIAVCVKTLSMDLPFVITKTSCSTRIIG